MTTAAAYRLDPPPRAAPPTPRRLNVAPDAKDERRAEVTGQPNPWSGMMLQGVSAPPTADDDAVAAWMVVRGNEIPGRWQERAVPAYVIPLVASEVEQIFGTGRLERVLGPDDERLAALLADDAPQARIAHTLGISLRTVQRRVGLLRRQLGVSSSRELQQRLRAMGYGVR